MKKLFFSLFIFCSFSVRAADIRFDNVYVATKSNSTVTLTSGVPMNISNAYFTNNLGTAFSGNDVGGSFIYTDATGSHTITGTVSFKNGNSPAYGLYFVVSSGSGYYFEMPGNTLPNGTSFNVNSSGVSTELNALASSVAQVAVDKTSLNTFSACINAPSASQTFTVSGKNLSAGVTIIAPTGFEISLDGSNSFTVSKTIAFDPTSKTVSSTTIYARLAANNTAQTFASNFIISSSTNSNKQYTIVQGTIYDLSISGTPAAAATNICAGIPASLTLSGSVGSIVWQQSTDLGSSWSNATTGTGTSTSSYTTANLSASTYYRALVTSGACSTATSTTVSITVNPTSVGGAISGTSTVCAPTNSTLLTLSGYTGDITKWQSSTSASFTSSITDISASTSTITVTNLLETTYYRAVVTSGACTSANSSIFTLTVNSAPSITSQPTSLSKTDGDNATLNVIATGTSLSYQWQINTGSGFSNISNGGVYSTASTATLNFTNVTEAMSGYKYQCIITGTCAPSSVTSSEVTLTVSSAVSTSPATTVTVGGSNTSITISNTVASYVDEGLTITSNGLISGFIVTITDSYTVSDVLTYTETLPSTLTVTAFNTTTRSLVFSGAASASEWRDILRKVQLTTSSAVCFPEKRKISFIAGDVYYNTLNEHFYKVSSGASSWTTAKTNAAVNSYFGREGYLATLTSQSENSFVRYLVGQNSWIGASDHYSEINSVFGYNLFADQTASEGKWYWITGPEKGTQMREGNADGLPLPNAYQNWTIGEPNDCCGTGIGEEDYGHVYGTGNGLWNDFANTRTIFSIIEFGGMPNDNTSSQVVFTREVYISNPPSGTITGGNVSVCSGINTELTLTGLIGSVTAWEYSLDNFLTAGITISNSTTILTVSPTESTYYRAKVNTGACPDGVTSSTLVKVSTTIAGNTTAQNQTICAGGKAELTLFGNAGNVLRWVVSNTSDFTTSSTISNTTTNLSYELTPAGSYYLKAEVSNGCGVSAYSGYSTISVTTGTPPNGGTINSVSACGPTNAGTLTLSGYTGTISKWQTSTDGGIIWSDISGTGSTTTTYSFSNVSSNKYFKALVVDPTCGTSYSSVGIVSYYRLPKLNIIGNTSGFNKVGLTASGGSTYSWSDGDNITSASNSFEESGIYVVSMSDANNCTVSETVNVQIKILGVSRSGEITSDSTIQVNAHGVIASVNPITQSGNQGSRYKKIRIGDNYKGGIVAYILKAGDPGYISGEQHGIIASTIVDLTNNDGVPYGTQTNTNATGTAIGTGLSNTLNIITSIGASTNYAAGLARAYRGGGYSDWYLPSEFELTKIYENRAKIGGFVGSSKGYWSSTSLSSTIASGLDDKTGSTFYGQQDFTNLVRAVRSF